MKELVGQKLTRPKKHEIDLNKLLNGPVVRHNVEEAITEEPEAKEQQANRQQAGKQFKQQQKACQTNSRKSSSRKASNRQEDFLSRSATFWCLLACLVRLPVACQSG